MSFKPQIVCHFLGGQGGVSCFRTDPAALGGAVACWDWVWIYQKKFSFIHQLFIYSPFWGHMFLENHRKICSLWVLSSLVWCEQTGEQSFRKAFLKSRMEKGFSKSAPKLWCFSSRVWKFQNHSGAVVNHKLLDSEEFGDFLLCRLFVLMDNLLFQGGCGGNPNWCIKTSTVWKIMQIWSRICRTAALVGLITNWANHKLGW